MVVDGGLAKFVSVAVEGARPASALLVDELAPGNDDPEEAADRTIEGLSEALRSVDFRLVLAAPTIPEGVQRNIEYLNARGLSVFGLEVSYFAGAVEAFVPRIVVRPSLGARIAGQDTRRPSPPITPDAFLETLPERARPMIAQSSTRSRATAVSLTGSRRASASGCEATPDRR